MKEKKVYFKSYDGYELEGIYVKADNEKGALLFVHGIASSMDELGFHSNYAKFLSENGISTLRFNYRYHGGANEESTDLIEMSLCGIVNDIDAAFSVLKENTASSTNSFFIVGTSFGGGLSAFWTDTKGPQEIRKVILNAPVISYENDVLERNHLVDNGMLSEKAQDQLNGKGYVCSSGIHFGRGLINELQFVNTIKSVEDLGSRIVIFHGEKDDDVPISSSRKYMPDLAELIEIKGVGHGFGVEGDEDLNFPETRDVHLSIYKKALEIIEASL